MSYELQKPYTEKQKVDFIVEYNHQKGLRIEETDMYLFALEANEVMGEKEIEIEVPDFETVIEEYQEPAYVTVEKEELDEDGNVIGTYTVEELDHYETLTREVEKQVGTHIETKIIPYPVINSDYEAEQAQKERGRINMLSLTAADVERAIYKAKGMDFEDVIEMVSKLVDTSPLSSPQGEGDSPQIDVKALKIELKANNFYRGNPYIEQVGALLGFTPEMLDEFFETNDYTKLIIPAEEQDSNAVEEGVQDTPSNINVPKEEEVNADTTNTESDVQIPTPIEDSIPEA